MIAIVTGANGTLGSVLCERLRAQGHTAVPWDRTKIPIDDFHAMDRWVGESSADAIFHLAIASKATGRENEGWLVNYHWPGELAWIARQRGLRFIFTSTAMVFTNRASGPFTPNSFADETEGYGAEKIRAESRVRSQHPDGARVVRIGWQIGRSAGSNNMIDFFEKNMREHSVIRASARWLPACSFLEDTADALITAHDLPPGLYHADGNRAGNNFYEIASALNRLHGMKWKIERTDDFAYDQRLLDARLPVKAIGDTLGG